MNYKGYHKAWKAGKICEVRTSPYVNEAHAKNGGVFVQCTFLFHISYTILISMTLQNIHRLANNWLCARGRQCGLVSPRPWTGSSRSCPNLSAAVTSVSSHAIRDSCVTTSDDALLPASGGASLMHCAKAVAPVRSGNWFGKSEYL